MSCEIDRRVVISTLRRAARSALPGSFIKGERFDVNGAVRTQVQGRTPTITDKIGSIVSALTAELGTYGEEPSALRATWWRSSLARSGTVAFPEETALFRKSLLTLTGVVRDIWPTASIDEVLIASGGQQFAAESWMRAIVPMPARAFGTHVSNGDLLRFMSALRWTPARYVLGAYRDALDVMLR